MKKIITLLVSSVVVICGVIGAGAFTKGNIKEVNVYKIKPETVKDTVICSGKIQYKETYEISPKTAGVIKEIFVSKGQYVNQGDKLFSMETDLSSLSSDVAEKITKTINNNIITVTATENGTIFSISVDEGDTVVTTQPAITIANSNDLCVNMPVSESKISSIKTGQYVEITGSGFNKAYTGKIDNIDNVAKQVVTTTGKETAVDVMVHINNPDENIKQGYTAKCTITTNTKNNSYIVPYDAITLNGNRKGYVYVFSNGNAIEKLVNVGNEYENGVEVISGLKENELIITNVDGINDNQPVTVSKVLVNTNG